MASAPAMPATASDWNWRTQFEADYRQTIVNKIGETLKSYLHISGEEGLLEIKKIAIQFEENIYTTATSELDYLRRISLKMMTMETKSESAMANSLQSRVANTDNPFHYQGTAVYVQQPTPMSMALVLPKPQDVHEKIPTSPELDDLETEGPSEMTITFEKVLRKKQRGEREFRTQCKPQGIYDLLPILTEKQKQDVVRIGFGGLLKLSLTSIPTKMMKWLVKNFNGTTQILTVNKNTRFVITPDDICDVFLLPRNEGRQVLKLTRKDNLPITGVWKDKYGIDTNGNIPLSKLTELIKERLTQGGADFIRFFILYSLSSFLTPTSNRLVDFSAIKSLIDVEKISDFDWCSYILTKLCQSVDKYNNRPKMKNISGCVLVLQILYFHRLKWRGKPEPSTLPLIQHWNNEKIRTRIKEEISAGAFGQGEWDLTTYPLTCKSRATTQNESSKPRRHTAPSQTSASKAIETSEEVRESLRFIKFDLLENEPDDSQIHQLAKDDIQEAYLQLKRDMAVIANVHMRRLGKLERKMKGKNAPNTSSELPHEFQTHTFFSDPNIHGYINEMVEKIAAMKTMADAMRPSFEHLTTHPTANDDKITNEKENQDAEEKGYSDENLEDLANTAVQISEQAASAVTSKKRKADEQ